MTKQQEATNKLVKYVGIQWGIMEDHYVQRWFLGNVIFNDYINNLIMKN